MRLTLQPLDAPPDAAAAARRSSSRLGSDELLMFSTDYPHRHFDTPEEALPAGPAGRPAAARSWRENARAFYRL